MKKIVLLAAVAALFVSMMSLPALADSGIGVLSGTADVGRIDNGGCDEDTVDGDGLYLPGVNDADPGYYRLNATTVSAPGATGSINVCGELGAVAVPQVGDVGAACGMSRGHSGSGTASTSIPAQTLTLSNVGWPATAGGTLPIEGDYSVANAKLVGGTNGGEIVGVVQAQGGANCVAGPHNTGQGAQSFTVVGVYALLQD